MTLRTLILLAFLALVHAATYTNPLNGNKGADPCMRYINGQYYLMTTQNTEIAIRRASTIEGLKTASKTTLYTESNAERNFSLWAPEFWYLSGRWYIYYSAAPNGDNALHRLYVLQGGTDANNPTSGAYSFVGGMSPSNWGSGNWAADASILALNGANYFMYSGIIPGKLQCLYIAPMSSPTRLSGPAVEINCPSLSWENVGNPVQEGPQAITVNGVTRIIYSASFCGTDDYALGMLTFRSGANPLTPSSWTKNPNPVFTKNVGAGVYGPGHHFMFQKGNAWYFAYHGKSAAGQGCGDVRNTRVQTFTIGGSDGATPIFPAAAPVSQVLTEI